MFLNLEKSSLSSSEIKTEHTRINYYNYNLSQDGVFDPDNSCRFYVMLSGEMEVSLDSKNKTIFNQNQFIIAQPNTEFDIYIKKGTKLFCFDITEDLINSISGKVSLDIENITDSLKNSKLYQQDLSQNMTLSTLNIFNTYFSSDEDKPFLLDIYIQELIYYTFKKLNLSIN